MAEIKVQIKGDTEDFKKKMGEASAEAGNFSKAFEKSFDQVKDGASDLMKEQGLGQIIDLFGKTGLAVGVGAFGTALVDAFKEGIDSAIKFEDTVTHLQLALGTAQGGQAEDIAKWAESISGAISSVDETIAAFQKFTQAGMGIEEAKTAVIAIGDAAAKTNSSFEELAKAFSDMKALGEIEPRFFREFPAIGAIVKNLLGPGASPLPGAPKPTPEAEDESLMARVKAAGGADWMVRTVLPAISPGGLQSPDRLALEATELGQLKALGVQYEAMEREIGNALLPDVKEFTGLLKAELPVIEADLKGFAEALDATVHFLGGIYGQAFQKPGPGGVLTAGGQALEMGPAPFHGVWDSITEGIMKAVNLLSDSTKTHAEVAERLNRALSPH